MDWAWCLFRNNRETTGVGAAERSEEQVKEVIRGQVKSSFESLVRTLTFNSEGNGEPVQEFEQSCDAIWCVFQRTHSGCCIENS